MLHSWSYYPSTLSCSPCLRLENNKYPFGSVGVFHQQSPCTWSLPCLYEQVHFEHNMNEFCNSQTPPSEEPRSTSTNTLEILDTQAITTLRCLRTWTTSTTTTTTTTVLNKIKIGINRGLTTQRGDPGRPVIQISIGMMDFPEALCNFGSSVNIMPSASKISLYIKGRKDVFLQEQDYTNLRAILTWTKEEDQQEEQE